ncbi:MAG: nitroreductase family protein [Eubacteriales bacterium]|nr:nitroreductase family protein [Eubacteriales bacterium]
MIIMFYPVKINSERCIGCGRCAEECILGTIRLADGKAEVCREHCMQCGHCFSVCPVGAVSMDGYDRPEEKTEVNCISAENMLAFMKSRRSIRHFTAEKVSDREVDMIIEAGRYCPTAKNMQDLHFTVLDKTLSDIEKEAVSDIRAFFAASGNEFDRLVTVDDHFFFFGAPLVIVVSAERADNAGLAAAYMELMAESLGLGVLYCGYFTRTALRNEKIFKALELPEDRQPFFTLVIGHPDVEFKRIPPRKQPSVTKK